MEDTKQLTLMGNETPEQAEAIGLHYEIVSAAQAAASSLLDLGRKLKRMRDSGKYKALGFETFGDYTEQAVHIRQRQAYTYISVVESRSAVVRFLRPSGRDSVAVHEQHGQRPGYPAEH